MAAKTQMTKAGKIQRGQYSLDVCSIYLVVYNTKKDLSWLNLLAKRICF